MSTTTWWKFLHTECRGLYIIRLETSVSETAKCTQVHQVSAEQANLTSTVYTYLVYCVNAEQAKLTSIAYLVYYVSAEQANLTSTAYLVRCPVTMITLTLSVISPKGWAGLAHSICLLVAVSISHTDTSLFPLTAEMREEGCVGCALSWYTWWTWASGERGIGKGERGGEEIQIRNDFLFIH